MERLPRIAVRMASRSQPKSLIFDLEVAPGKADQPDHIFMFGALRPETGEALERRVDRDLPSVLDALNSLGQGASFLLSHSVIDYDSPTLKQQAPALALHHRLLIGLSGRIQNHGITHTSGHKRTVTAVERLSDTSRPATRLERSQQASSNC